jgi:hypothetical protein
MNHEITYTAPQIRDYGDLRELTAACESAGSGDFAFKDAAHTTIIGVPFNDSFCLSSPPRP